MNPPATASDTHHQRSVTARDLEQHTGSPGNLPGTIISTCDTKTSGLSKGLYAEHDIGKLRVLQSSGAGNGHDTMAKKYAMSVMAASVAETVTYPLDLTKTR